METETRQAAEQIKVSKTSLEYISKNLDKAGGLLDLVRQQLEAKHKGAWGVLPPDKDVTSAFQLAAILELVDGLLVEQMNHVNDMISVTAE